MLKFMDRRRSTPPRYNHGPYEGFIADPELGPRPQDDRSTPILILGLCLLIAMAVVQQVQLIRLSQQVAELQDITRHIATFHPLDPFSVKSPK